MTSKKLSTNNNNNNIQDLPDDLITNILLRLPLDAILKCSTLCKRWFILIKTPCFISSHSRFNNNNRYLLYWKDECRFKLIYDENGAFDTYKNNFRLPRVDYSDAFTTSTCNGIICIADLGLLRLSSTFTLWNPAIRKMLTLPKPGTIYPRNNNYSQYTASWFDFQTNDYKLIRILCFNEAKPTRVQFFSLIQNSWKTMSCTAPWFYCTSTPLPIFNGVLHWIVHFDRNYQSILGFDVNAEEFKTIELPSVCKAKGLCFTLAIYKETSLMICGDYDNAQGEVWVMEEYGNVQSWTKIWKYQSMSLKDFTITADHYPSIVGVLNSGKILWDIILAREGIDGIIDFGMDFGMIVSTDPTNGECVLIEYYQATNFYVNKGIINFEETLALLDDINAISM